MEKLGMPSTIRDAGVTQAEFEADVEAMAADALADRCTATNPRPCTKEDIIHIYHRAYAGRLL